MNPIQTLMNEHRTIEAIIGSLTIFLERARAVADARSELRQYVSLLRDFADHCHHAKEEESLFVALVNHGMRTDQGPIAVMLAEHAQGRALISELAQIGVGQGALSQEEVESARSFGASYAKLLLAHIQKEDGILYPLAERMLSPSTWADIQASFESFEVKNVEERERSLARIDEITRRYPACM